MVERSFRIEESMYEQLREIAERENLPISYIVRVALAQFVDAYTGSVDLVKMRNGS